MLASMEAHDCNSDMHVADLNGTSEEECLPFSKCILIYPEACGGLVKSSCCLQVQQDNVSHKPNPCRQPHIPESRLAVRVGARAGTQRQRKARSRKSFVFEFSFVFKAARIC